MLTFNGHRPASPEDLAIDFSHVRRSCEFPIQAQIVGEVIGGVALGALPPDSDPEQASAVYDEIARQAAASELKEYWRLNFMMGVDRAMLGEANPAEIAQAQHASAS